MSEAMEEIGRRLEGLLERYPQLVRVFLEADYWPRPDGSVQFHMVIDDLEGLRPAFEEFADIIGMSFTEGGPETPLPTEPPVRFEDIPRRRPPATA